MIGEVIAGALYPFKALGTISRNPALWGYVAIPIGLNILLGILFYVGLLFAGFEAIDRLVAGLPEWLALLDLVLRVLLTILLLIVTGFLLVRVGVVVGSPWYSALSQRLEEMRSGRVLAQEPLSIGGTLRDLARSLGYELRKLLLSVAIGLPLFLLNFVPVIGAPVATAGWIALGSLISCLDFFDPPLERRRLRFREKIAVVRAHLPASAGFGLACLGLVSIPFINLLSIPVCITAGTLFFLDRIRLALPHEVPNT